MNDEADQAQDAEVVADEVVDADPGDQSEVVSHELLRRTSGERKGRHVLTGLWELMSGVANVPKSGELKINNKVRYKFRGIEATIQEVGQAARSVGLMLQSEVAHSEWRAHEVKNSHGEVVVWNRCMLVMEYIFTSLVDGSAVRFQAAGEGFDNSDKATSKAMSAALKYALGQALLLGTDDADSDSERPTAASAPQPARPQQAPQQPQGGQRSPAAGEPPAVRARKALAAAQAAQTVEKLVEITNYASREGIIQEEISGITLSSRLEAILAQLQRDDVEPMQAGGGY